MTTAATTTARTLELPWLETERGKLIAAIAYASPAADMSYARTKLAFVQSAIARMQKGAQLDQPDTQPPADRERQRQMIELMQRSPKRYRRAPVPQEDVDGLAIFDAYRSPSLL